MQKILFFLLLFVSLSFGDTRSNGLPIGFSWRYIIDEREPSPRTGQFWRDGIFFDDKIIVLNAHNLIALDMKGEVLWVRSLPLENSYSEAKIHQIKSNEIIIVIADALLKINTDTGDLLDHYGYNSIKKSVFQFTELLPRHSFLFNDKIYVFLSSELLAFDIKTLTRKKIFSFDSHPKTLPILYKNKIILGLQNGFVHLFDPISKNDKILIYGSMDKEFAIRQPIIQNDLIYIPTTEGIIVYKGMQLFSQTTQYQNSILDNIEGKIWLRQHFSNELFQIDETLSPLLQITYPKESDIINSPLIGRGNKLLNLDSIVGQMLIFEYNTSNIILLKELYVEDFWDNPPLQLLDQKDQYVLLGGFDGLYLVDIAKL